MTNYIMKKDTEHFFQKDLEIGLDDGTRYVVNPERDVCTRYRIVQTRMVKNSICIKQKIMEDYISEQIGLNLLLYGNCPQRRRN
jgi:hypothetical protein